MDESLTQIRHERSKKDFPWLSLHEGEYVEYAFRRARICLYAIMGGTFFALVAILLGFLLTLLSQAMLDGLGRSFVFIILGALLASAVIIAAIAVMVYHGNQLVVTNKRVIQKMMESPVSSSVNIIDLGSVEDVSFHKKGILQTMFNYGTLRLATVGDETSYTFKYSDINREDLDGVQKLIANAKKRTKKVKEAKEDEAEETKGNGVEEAKGDGAEEGGAKELEEGIASDN